ncbi:hypothetical protein HMPREF9374_0072 [Desmospora sp. 8437]|nr:hypothetical protein HMPREF9374_0072 [Desmospora sp. 8437]
MGQNLPSSMNQVGSVFVTVTLCSEYVAPKKAVCADSRERD